MTQGEGDGGGVKEGGGMTHEDVGNEDHKLKGRG